MKKLHKTFSLGYLLSGEDHNIDAINFSVSDGPKNDGFLYEFHIALVQWRDGRCAMQARVYSDSWRAYADCPEVWELLASMHRCFEDGNYSRKGPEVFDDLVSRLEKAGWKNEGRLHPRYYRVCRECGSERTLTPSGARK